MNLIFENTPYRRDKNLVEAYNTFMELLPNKSWALFRDADTLFLNPFYGNILDDVINKYPEKQCFTAVTNRIYPKQQTINLYNGDDISEHRKIAMALYDKHGLTCEKFVAKPYMSGMCFLISKKAWKTIGGFKPWHKTNGKTLGVDNQLHIDLIKHGIDVMIMKGFYVYHWYRGGNTEKNGHLK